MAEIPGIALILVGLSVDLYSVYVGSHSQFSKFAIFLVVGSALIAWGVFKYIMPTPKKQDIRDPYFLEQYVAEKKSQYENAKYQVQQTRIPPNQYQGQYRQVNQNPNAPPVNPYPRMQPNNPYSQRR